MVVTEDGCSRVVGNWGNVVGGRRLVDDRVESVVVIGCVVNGAHRTVWLDQRVLSLDYITITFLSLRLDVTGVRVLDAIVE